MANGFHGAKDDWDRMELPLKQLDPEVKAFGAAHGLDLVCGGRWPDRSFRWGAPISRLIQIFVDDESRPTYKVWICASENRSGGRYWRQEFLRSGATIEELAADLPNMLASARAQLMAWGQSDLAFAVTLSPPAG